jgi:prepilin-type processing-associated H-X9-DG protein
MDLVASVFMLGTLCSIAVPALELGRSSSNLATCKSNLRQVAIALNDFDAQMARMPQPAGTNVPPGGSVSVLQQLAPYMEADVSMLGKADVPIVMCPADTSFVRNHTGTSYGINVRGLYGADGMGGQGPIEYSTLAQIPCGTSNFAFAGDLAQAGTYHYDVPAGKFGTSEGAYNGCLGSKPKSSAPATGPYGNVPNAPVFSSYHEGSSVNIALADGHVVNANISPNIKSACVANNGNVTGEWYDRKLEPPSETPSSDSSPSPKASSSWWEDFPFAVVGFASLASLGLLGIVAVVMIIIVQAVRRPKLVSRQVS